MAMKFHEIVEEVKRLGPEDKLYLKDLLDRMLMEEKRRLIRVHAEESLREYEEGKIKFGTVDELKRELHED
jgi:hypothetical protein